MNWLTPRSRVGRQSLTSDGMTLSGRRLWQVAIVVFIAFELYVASRGLEVFFGLWAPAIVMVSIILRFGLTFVIGAFLYALFILEWPAELSMLFAAPAILFMFPKLLPDIADVVEWWRTRARVGSGSDGE